MDRETDWATDGATDRQRLVRMKRGNFRVNFIVQPNLAITERVMLYQWIAVLQTADFFMVFEHESSWLKDSQRWNFLLSNSLNESSSKRKCQIQLKEISHRTRQFIFCGARLASLGYISTCLINKIDGMSAISVREQTRTWSPKVKNDFMSWGPMGMTL